MEDAKDSEELVNLNDFMSIKLFFEIQNLTAGSALLGGNDISLSEIRDRVLVFELPAASCNVEHSIMLSIGRRESGPESEIKLIFKSTGKISRVKELKDDKIRVVVSLVQFDEASWQSFTGLFAQRQEEITAFLRQVKP